MRLGEVIAVAAIGTVALLLLYGLAPLARAWAVRNPRLAETIPPLLLTAGVGFLLWPLLLGDMPYTHDHSVHLTRAWIFVHEMLGRGRLYGWSDVWFAGWPAGDDYPMGADVLVSGVYLGTLGLAGWVASYGIAYFVSHVAWVLAPYALARVHFDRTTAFLAGLFTLIDAGSGRQWGWQFAVETGVWPQAFATGLVLYSLASMELLIRHGRRRDWALTAVTLGYALITHPFTVIWIGLGVPSFLVVRVLLAKGPRGPMIVRALGATALGIALGSFWLIPFVVNADWFQKAADLWLPLEQIASRLFTGTVYDHLLPPVLFLAVAGGVIGVRRRDPAAVWLFVLAAVTLFISSRALVVDMDLIDDFAMLGRILFERFAYVVRPCLALLAAYALGRLFQIRPVAESLGRRAALTALVMLAVAPFLIPLGQVWADAYRPGQGLVTTSELGDWDDYQAFLRWSKAEQERERRFYRIAYVDDGHFLASAPVWNETPAIRTEYTPATTFRFKPSRFDVSLSSALNVKYVVSTRPLADTSRFREVRRFGRFVVYELVGWTDRRVTLTGPGEVRVRRIAPEDGDVRFRVTGSDGSGQIIVHVAHYADWHATRDGAGVPIHEGELGGETGWIALDAANGSYEIRYSGGGDHLLGNVITILALLLVLALALGRFAPPRLLPVLDRARALVRAVEDRGAIVGVVCCALFAVALVAKLALGPPEQDRPFASQLDRARAEMVRTAGGRTPCEEIEPERFQCSDEEWNNVRRHYTWMLDADGIHMVDGAIRRCIWMHPRADAEVRVTFPGTRLGRRILGEHGLQNRGSGTLELIAYAGEEELGRARLREQGRWTEWEIDTSAHRGDEVDLTFGVRIPAQGPYHYCWDARIER